MDNLLVTGLTYSSEKSGPEGRFELGPTTLDSRWFCPLLSPICLWVSLSFMAPKILTTPSGCTGDLCKWSNPFSSHFRASRATVSGESLTKGPGGDSRPCNSTKGSRYAMQRSSGRNSEASHEPVPASLILSGSRS